MPVGWARWLPARVRPLQLQSWRVSLCVCLSGEERPGIGGRVRQPKSQSHSLIFWRRDRADLRPRLDHLPAPPLSYCYSSSPSPTDWPSLSLVSCGGLRVRKSDKLSLEVLSSHPLHVCECVRSQGLSLGFRVCPESFGRGYACPSHPSLRRDAAAPLSRGSDAGIPQFGVGVTNGVPREGTGVSGRSPRFGLPVAGRLGICEPVRSVGTTLVDAVAANPSVRSSSTLCYPFSFRSSTTKA